MNELTPPLPSPPTESHTPACPQCRQRRWSTWLIRLLLAVLVVSGGVWWNTPGPADPRQQYLLDPPPIAPTPRGATREITIASFNIHGGKGVDGRTDLARTATALDGVDFAGLQEVRWLPGEAENQAFLLARRRGGFASYLPTERRWGWDHFGNGWLSRSPVRWQVTIPLVNTRRKAYRCATLLELGDGPPEGIRVLLVHADREGDRAAHLRTITKLFRSLQSPCVLLGDLNANASEPLLDELLTDPTITVAAGRDAPRRNDWLLVRGLTVTASNVVDNGASDHPAVIATLRWDPPGDHTQVEPPADSPTP